MKWNFEKTDYINYKLSFGKVSLHTAQPDTILREITNCVLSQSQKHIKQKMSNKRTKHYITKTKNLCKI